ncbi:DMT family transporter [Orrella daihaiensis]|uniref:DMT family transporter n=1 Tax=Orrella daihaiensis TaxID=2782176 RepID=A0ABY4AGH6_9BURK|nr:DMT family transporter [Orrella daihaiensis]UOD49381.1 DMT family transporter [Orrella daihaiensis]
MSHIRQPLDARAVSLMLLLCILWGGQQSVIKLVADDMAATLQISLRSGIGLILIAGFMAWRGISFAMHKGPWRAGIIAGLLFGFEFLFIGEGLRYTTASHMAVFLYTAPIFTALGLHFLIPEERLSKKQWLGISLCFVGIAVAFLGGFAQPTISNKILWGDFLGLMAGFLWGSTTVVIRVTGLNRIPAAQTTLYQLVAAFVILLLAAMLSDQMTVNWTPELITALAAQGIVIAFFTLLVWFWLLSRYLASRLASFTFLTPLFGVAFGVLLLDDPLDIAFVLGAALVIIGVSVVNHPKSR